MLDVISIMNIALMGCIAGIIMGMVAMALRFMNFTTLNITQYMGCMLTGRSQGLVSFIVGFMAHLMMSAMFAILYMLVIAHFNMALTLFNIIYIGLAHTFFSGIMLPIMDRLNNCVKSGALRYMGYFAYHYGFTATITFVIGHFVYAISLYLLLK